MRALGAAAIFAAIIVTATMVYNNAQADSRAERTSLTGLKGVHVCVEKIDPDLNMEILDTKIVQKSVEVMLGASGIKVLTEEEMLKTPGMPYLYINLSTAKSGMVYGYHCSMELRQGAVLERDPNTAVTATTWSGTAITGVVSGSELNVLRTILDDGVNEFIKAYNAANKQTIEQAKNKTEKGQL